MIVRARQQLVLVPTPLKKCCSAKIQASFVYSDCVGLQAYRRLDEWARRRVRALPFLRPQAVQPLGNAIGTVTLTISLNRNSIRIISFIIVLYIKILVVG